MICHDHVYYYVYHIILYIYSANDMHAQHNNTDIIVADLLSIYM